MKRIAVTVPGVEYLWIPDTEGDAVWAHGWESHVEREVLAACAAPGAGTFIDVGANIGYYARLVAQRHPGLHVVAVEPSPVLAPILRMNLHDTPNAHVLPVIAGAQVGVADFYFRCGAEGSGRSYDPTAHDANAWERVARPVVPLALVADTLPPIRAVKVDVEGYEWEVLRGAEAAADTFVVEVHATYLRERGVDLAAFYGWIAARFDVTGTLPQEGNGHVRLDRRS